NRGAPQGSGSSARGRSLQRSLQVGPDKAPLGNPTGTSEPGKGRANQAGPNRQPKLTGAAVTGSTRLLVPRPPRQLSMVFGGGAHRILVSPRLNVASVKSSGS